MGANEEKDKNNLEENGQGAQDQTGAGAGSGNGNDGANAGFRNLYTIQSLKFI